MPLTGLSAASFHRPASPPPSTPRRRISIGEIDASSQPTLLHTILGSCVSVCLRDPVSGIGGMNHILLPEGPGLHETGRFGVNAMELLINKMMKLGADRHRLVAKAFGAGNVLACLQSPTVGERNAQFVRQFLNTEGIPLLAQRLGGTDAVEVTFTTDTGHVLVRSVTGYPLSSVVAREEHYRRRPAIGADANDVTLF